MAKEEVFQPVRVFRSGVIVIEMAYPGEFLMSAVINSNHIGQISDARLDEGYGEFRLCHWW